MLLAVELVFEHLANITLTMALEGQIDAKPLPDETKIAIIDALWPNAKVPTTPHNICNWDAYFEHYTAECHRALHAGRGEHITIRKHADIAAIARELQDGLTKEDIADRLVTLDTQQRDDAIKKRMAEGSLRLVARLLAMVDIGPISPYHIQGPTPLDWSDDSSTIQSTINNYFIKSTTPAGAVKLSRDFTAVNIERFAGIKIVWTNNLADHLRFVDDDTKLCVFHHTNFLRHQDDSILPDGLAEETMRTLSLLFPRFDKSTRRWLASYAEKDRDFTMLDNGLLECARLHESERGAEKFEYWRDELITIAEVFDRSRGRTLRALWHDRRDPMQFYNFFFSVVLVLCLTTFFGLIQSIEGAMQVYKAYHPTV